MSRGQCPGSNSSTTTRLETARISTDVAIKTLKDARPRPSTIKEGLKNVESSAILGFMNAMEVIEEIKRLPDEEREKVVEFVRHLPNAETVEAINEPIEGLPHYKSMDEVRKAIKDFVHDA